MSEKYKISVHQFDPKMARVNLFHMRPNETLIASQDTRRPDLLAELVADANRGAAAQQAPAAVDLDALRERVLTIIAEQTDITFENTVTIKYAQAKELIHAAFDEALKPKEHPDAAQATGNH
jgi:hypothetical protein